MQNHMPIEACVATLAAHLPIDDIWYFEAADAPECGLAKPFHLVLLAAAGEEAWTLEERAAALLGERARDMAVHVFPGDAAYRLPRPLLLKMAFTAGKRVFQREAPFHGA